jgi:hypothetical protein
MEVLQGLKYLDTAPLVAAGNKRTKLASRLGGFRLVDGGRGTHRFPAEHANTICETVLPRFAFGRFAPAKALGCLCAAALSCFERDATELLALGRKLWRSA